MRLFKYLHYFFYIAYNWNIFIAIHIIYYEIKGEKRYGLDTIGIDKLDNLEDDQVEHASIYMPAIYSLLERVFAEVDMSKTKHLLDIGSGKGRAICVAALKGCKQVSGIELSKPLCLDALQNLTQVLQVLPQLQAKIINKDAYNYPIPADVDCIFLFNPFDEFLMRQVVENILLSLTETPREMTVIYENPLHKSLFTNKGFKETYYWKKMHYLEVSILKIGA